MKTYKTYYTVFTDRYGNNRNIWFNSTSRQAALNHLRSMFGNDIIIVNGPKVIIDKDISIVKTKLKYNKNYGK